jgi:hypothetical protein
MMLYLNGVRNFTVKGLSFDGGASASTPFDQQNHAIAFWGGSNLTVDGNTFSNLMGDGVVLLAHNSGTDCPNGANITNNTMNGSGIGRNGISSVCGSGHNIIGNTITDWSRGDMPGGIDLEPDNGTQSLNDVLVEGNTIGFSGSTQEPLSTWWKSGIHSALNYTGARSSNVTIRGNDISGKVANGIMISTHPSDVWRVENNTVRDVGSSQAYSGIRNAHGGSHIYSGDTITNIDGGSGYCIALDSWMGGSPQLSNNTTSGCR